MRKSKLCDEDHRLETLQKREKMRQKRKKDLTKYYDSCSNEQRVRSIHLFDGIDGIDGIDWILDKNIK